jgi:hypothetical protein
MTGSSRFTPNVARRALMALLMPALLDGVSCSEFPRNNPVDASATVALELTGPDSTDAIGDTVRFELRSKTGERLNGLARWTAPSFLKPIDYVGGFVVSTDANVVRTNGTVTAAVNANEASKPFILSRTPLILSVSNCTGGKEITFTALTPASTLFANGAQSVCVALFDRRGGPMVGSSLVTATIRRPGVVKFSTADQRQLAATSTGSTYVVYSSTGLSDSILVTVRQDFAKFAMDPPTCAFLGPTLKVGETLQLSVIDPPLDANGNPIIDPYSAPRASQSTFRWGKDNFLNASLTQTGLLTMLGVSEGFVYAELIEGGSVRRVAGCRITVR